MLPERPISDVLDDVIRGDASVTAYREVLRRASECQPYLPVLLRILEHPNHAISDCAFRTFEKIGNTATQILIDAFPASNGRLRSDLLSLLSTVGDFDCVFPLLAHELLCENDERRFWAANCLGRLHTPDSNWTETQSACLKYATELLLSTRSVPQYRKYWHQGRMTLKRLGVIPHDTT
jgi:HEAT repeat protein